MADIVHFNLSDATERTTTVTSSALTEITERTVNWSDLTTAGFSAGDVVFVIWNWSLGGASTTTNALCNIGFGTTFAGRSEEFAVDIRTEPQDTSSLNGHRHFGWFAERTLVVNENIYFGMRTVSSSDEARSANFSITLLKRADLAADDYRFNENTSGLSVNTTWQTHTSVTLPSTSGDDWLILACGNWDVASTSVNLEQRINIGASNFMTISLEGEDTAEQMPLLCALYHENAGASDVVNIQAREDTSSSFVLDHSRVLALRLNAFTDYVGQHDTTTDAVSGTDNYVETGTVSLSLTATGVVFVIGQSLCDAADTGTDPYLRLQENNTDIVTSMGRASDHARDATDFMGIWVHVAESMTSGTKTIDMDVAKDEGTTTFNVVERTLVAFSMDLAGAPPVTGPPPSLALLGVGV